MTDVRWAYIILKGYGVWRDEEEEEHNDDYHYYSSSSSIPMLISPLVFARPHYRTDFHIINCIPIIHSTTNTINSNYIFGDISQSDSHEGRRRGRQMEGGYIDNRGSLLFVETPSLSTSSSSTTEDFSIDLRLTTPILAGEEVFLPASNIFSNAYAYSYRGIWLHRNNSRMSLKLVIPYSQPVPEVKEEEQQQTSRRRRRRRSGENEKVQDISIWRQYGCPVVVNDDDDTRYGSSFGSSSFLSMKLWLSREDGVLMVDDRLLPCFRLYSLIHHGYYYYDHDYHVVEEEGEEEKEEDSKRLFKLNMTLNKRLPYKLELYAAKALLKSIENGDVKRMIRSSSSLLLPKEGSSSSSSVLKDKSLLQVPGIEVREVEAGLLIQLVNTINDYITIIDNIYDDDNIPSTRDSSSSRRKSKVDDIDSK